MSEKLENVAKIVTFEIANEPHVLELGSHILYMKWNVPDAPLLSIVSINPCCTDEIKTKDLVAVICVNTSNVTITGLGKTQKILLAANVLTPFEHHRIKHRDCIIVNNIICLVTIKKVSLKVCQKEKRNMGNSTLNDGRANDSKVDDIYGMPTQISDSIHNAETQIERSPILPSPIKRKVFNRTNVKELNFNSYTSPKFTYLNISDKTNDSDAILNCKFENNFGNQESQNLLADYNSPFDSENSTDLTQADAMGKSNEKNYTTKLDDDSSTDIDEFEINTELPKSLSTQSKTNSVKIEMDPYEVLTQIDINSTKPSKSINNKLNIRNKASTEKKNGMALGKINDRYDNPIIRPEKDKACPEFEIDLYDLPTQIILTADKKKKVDNKSSRKLNVHVDDDISEHITIRNGLSKVDQNGKNPFYASTQDIYDDLKSSQVSEPIAKKMSRNHGEFLIPQNPTVKKSKKAIANVAHIDDDDDPFYASTQDIFNELNAPESSESVLKESPDNFKLPMRQKKLTSTKKTNQRSAQDEISHYPSKADLCSDLNIFKVSNSIAKKSPPNCGEFIIPQSNSFAKKSKEIDQKSKHNDNDDPFYECTQDILNDLVASQSSESVLKESPVACEEFVIPRKQLTALKQSNKTINYYMCTQDLEKDLCTQRDAYTSTSKKNLSDLSNRVNDNMIDLTDSIPSSQESDGDSYLFPTIKDRTCSTPERNTKYSVLDIELPDSPLIKRYSKMDYVPESPLVSESEDQIESSPPITFRSIIPTKRKAKAKESAKSKTEPKPKKPQNNDKKKTTKKETVNKKNTKTTRDIICPNPTVVIKKLNIPLLNNSSNGKIVERKRKADKPVDDVKEKQSKVTNNLRSSSRIQNEKPVVPRKIMVTGAPLDAKFYEIIKNLGGEIVQKDADILIAEKFSRTFKSMMSISRGIPIVTPRWLTDSNRCSRFVDTTLYLINDKDYEKKYSFKFEKLWQTPRKKFLKGWTIFITPSIQPPPLEMEEIIKCNGGVCVLEKRPTVVPITNMKNSFTVSCLKDKNIFTSLPRPHLAVDAISIGVFTREIDFKNHILDA